MNNYQLFCGDCLEVMPTLADASIDGIFCDLPYGQTACKWDSVIPFDALWKEYKRIIKPKGAIVLFGSQPFTSALIMSNLKWFKYCDIWHKTKPTGHLNAKVMPLRQHEDIAIFAKGRTTYNPQFSHKSIENRRKRTGEKNETVTTCYGKHTKPRRDDNDVSYPRSVIEFNQPNHGETGLHPTQKPVALLEYLIRTYTNEGDTVLDNTMGSGSAGVAAMQTGRNFIGIERDAAYFQIAQTRIEQAQPALFEVTA